MTEGDKITFRSHEIEWDTEKAGHLWNFYGASLAHKNKYFGERIGPHLVRMCKRMGLFKNVSTIIDFSCGTGAVIETLLHNLPGKVRVFGYDPSASSIHHANERNYGHANFAGAFQIKSLPVNIDDGVADLVFLTEVVEHLDDKILTAVLSECLRMLAPGGKLVVTTPNEEDLQTEKTMCPECGCIFHRWQHQRSWSEFSLGDYLMRVGFSRIRTKTLAWGNECIDFFFTVTGKKKTGILVIAQKI